MTIYREVLKAANLLCPCQRAPVQRGNERWLGSHSDQHVHAVEAKDLSQMPSCGQARQGFRRLGKRRPAGKPPWARQEPHCRAEDALAAAKEGNLSEMTPMLEKKLAELEKA